MPASLVRRGAGGTEELPGGDRAVRLLRGLAPRPLCFPARSESCAAGDVAGVRIARGQLRSFPEARCL